MTRLSEVIRNTLDSAEEDINDLEDMTDQFKMKQTNKKDYERNDHNLVDLWGNVK